MVTRFLIAAPIAFAALFSIANVASAATSQCATVPAQLRATAATADATKAKMALSSVRTGEALCAAGADREASRKFAVAAKLLGVDTTQVAAVQPVSAAN